MGRLYHDKDWLQSKYDSGWSQEEIAASCCVSQSTIYQ